MSDTIKAVFLRDTRPHEWDSQYRVGQVVELTPDLFGRWERRGAVKRVEIATEKLQQPIEAGAGEKPAPAIPAAKRGGRKR